jgi:superfamily II DNA or RNA helicase
MGWLNPRDFEYLEGRVDLKALQPFQIEVHSKLFGVLRGTAARAIVTLPTGAGKSRVLRRTSFRRRLIGHRTR